eukprot:symbB.v1.2.034593.t1/scaffold4478.1/size49402/1
MLHVFSPISGEDIAVLNTDELEETSAETLKEHLAPIVGITRFRQRLFSEDGSEIGCEDLSLSQKVQLVLLQLVEPNAEQEQQMLNACWGDDAQLLESLLKEPLDPNVPVRFGNGFEGLYPLHVAATLGSLQCARMLVEAGAEKDSHASNQQFTYTALFLAAQGGHIEIVCFLTEAGSDKNICANNGASPLFIAAQNGHVDIVRFLTEAGSDKEKANNTGETPLFIAARQGHIQVVRFLTEAGSDKNKSSNTGATPLYIAAQNGHIEVVRFLTEAGSDKEKANNTGETPLFIAAQQGHIEMVQFLTDAGSDKDKADDSGETPLFIAAQHGHIAIAHARSSAYDLFLRGHSVIALCADLVLLRDGSHRHANEMKMERATEARHWATPLESQRARLASSALVSQLRRHKKALGAFLHLGDALAAETLCLSGFEAVVLDHEQGPGNLSNAIGLVHAAASAGTHTLLRVPSDDIPYLRRALQLGLEGLILPMAETTTQVEDFLAAVKKSYPSSSLRGAGGHASVVRSVAPSAAQFLRKREELLLKAVQVETEVGLAAVREMVKVEGLGAKGTAEAGLLLALQTAEAEVKRAKKLLGGMLVPGRSVEQMLSAGYDLVCTTSDVILLRAAAENIVREAKISPTGPKTDQLQFITSTRQAKFAKEEETLVMKLKKSPQAHAMGVLSRLGSALAAELVAQKGFEVVVLDHAKGAEDLLGAMGIIHGTARAGAHALLRLPVSNLGHLRRGLFVGVEGVILPVETAEQAHQLVELCLYPSRNLREDSHTAEARMKNQPFRRMDFSFAPGLKTSEDLPELELRNPSR